MNTIGKSTRLLSKNKIEIFEETVPDVREDGMLIEIGLAGICGTDIHIIENADRKPMEDWLPLTLGHEVTGRVAKMGKNANDFMMCDEKIKEGDKIVLYVFLPCGKCWWERTLGTSHNLICDNPRGGYCGGPDKPPYFVGGWGEYMYIQPGSHLWKVPEEMPFELSVLTEPFSMGVRAVEKAMCLPPWKNLQMMSFGGLVAVLGSGAIGISTAIAAKIAGCGRVVLIGGPKKTLEIAKEMGAADEVLDIDDYSPQERIDKVIAMSDYRAGADVVFEAAGVPQAFIEGIEMTRKEGTFVELGCLIGDGTTVPLNVASHIVAKDITLYGVTNQPPQDFTKAMKCFEHFSDRFDFAAMVTHTFALEEFEKAIELSKDPLRKGIKIALKGKAYR